MIIMLMNLGNAWIVVWFSLSRLLTRFRSCYYAAWAELFDIQRTHITVHHMLILDEQSYMCWVWTSATNIEYDRWLLLRLSSYCIKGTLQFILGLVHTSSGLVFQFSCLEAHAFITWLYHPSIIISCSTLYLVLHLCIFNHITFVVSLQVLICHALQWDNNEVGGACELHPQSVKWRSSM